jgi:hypothetical protein
LSFLYPFLDITHIGTKNEIDMVFISPCRALNVAEKNNGSGGGNVGIATCGLARVKYAKGILMRKE